MMHENNPPFHPRATVLKMIVLGLLSLLRHKRVIKLGVFQNRRLGNGRVSSSSQPYARLLININFRASSTVAVLI